ncbi:MAG: 50S ribosomal protein L18 [Chloroflexi bacterium CFX1]|nr:50S ribosomal protein L18 [Chloroflexi bacterium CFX1]MCK6569074.1 50S ribosomal protein L18 [Anaerolineales bacterium]MCQ3952116.1 50S ribosomal protein L18 [Chloroflexota bacterium]MDL1918792.1 50S ribosomal protein L18 [Chloroflexi bacterium CFX5]NUQ57965.1 50S ribosomal protein L18 [Anaerolineales bacterium]
MANKSRSLARERRHARVRKQVFGNPERPRLNVFKSLTGIYAQIIDDMDGNTLVSASTVDKELREKVKGMKKSEQAKAIGQAIAERAKNKGISSVVFDRGGFRYTGRVKALADGAREGGLQF